MPTSEASPIDALVVTKRGEYCSSPGMNLPSDGVMIARPKSTLSTAMPTAPSLMLSSRPSPSASTP